MKASNLEAFLFALIVFQIELSITNARLEMIKCKIGLQIVVYFQILLK